MGATAPIITLDKESLEVAAILDLLHEYYEARDNTKRLRGKIDSFAAQLGMPRKECGQGLGHIYLDAYLVGLGIIPMARVTDGPEGAGK